MKYIAFLRGINVGGKSKVSMSDLKKLFEDLKFKNVKTLLNSGNVIFGSKKASEKEIEESLLKKFGFPISVILRTEKEIKSLVDKNSFGKNELNKQKRFYVTFIKNQPEVCSIVDLNSKGTTDMMKELEKKYGKEITTRNWNTIQKISTFLE